MRSSYPMLLPPLVQVLASSSPSGVCLGASVLSYRSSAKGLQMNTFNRVAVLAVSTALLAQQTYAVGLADLAASVDTVDILAGFTAVALLLGAVLAARMGIRKVLGMIK
jgi:hypothetical protein